MYINYLLTRLFACPRPLYYFGRFLSLSNFNGTNIKFLSDWNLPILVGNEFDGNSTALSIVYLSYNYGTEGLCTLLRKCYANSIWTCILFPFVKLKMRWSALKNVRRKCKYYCSYNSMFELNCNLVLFSYSCNMFWFSCPMLLALEKKISRELNAPAFYDLVVSNLIWCLI